MKVIHLNKANFENEVLNTEQKVLVDFWAPWCGPCKMLSPIIDEVAEEAGPEVKICKVNVDDEVELAQQFGVFSIPTVLVFKNGKIVNKAVGYRPKEQIEDLLK